MSDATSAQARTVDVVVVGFGAAGLTAAITAHDQGAEVLVLEKMPPSEAGGNTRVSGQVWFNPDDVELAKHHLRELSGEFPLPDDVVDAWAEESSRNTEFVRGVLSETLGKVERDPADPYGQGDDITSQTFPEAHAVSFQDDTLPPYEWPEIGGNECGTDYRFIGPTQGYSRLWNTLVAALEARDIEVLYATPARELIKDGDGAVTGVLADSPSGPLRLTARRGVVLASGGFENNQEMVRNYLRLPDSYPLGSPANTGDGHKMAQKAGADLWHMHNFCGVSGIVVEEGGKRMSFLAEPRGDSHVIVDNAGKRFIDERSGWRHGKSNQRGTPEHFPGIPMHYVFDQKALDSGAMSLPYDVYAGCWANVIDRYEWSSDNSVELEKGWIQRADSIEELAGRMKVDAGGLAETISRYNASCAEGSDPLYGRRPGSLIPIEGPPYYGISWDFVFLFTAGGPRKDGEARVLDPFGDVIPNLYCAGEVSYTYSWRSSGGMGVGDAMAFGRIAGRNAAASTA